MQCNTYILIHLLHFSSSTSVVAASLPSWQWPVGDCSAVPCRVRRPSPAWASVSVDCVQFSVLHSDPSVHQHHLTPHTVTHREPGPSPAPPWPPRPRRGRRGPPWWAAGSSQWRAPAARSWRLCTTGTGELAGSGAPPAPTPGTLSCRWALRHPPGPLGYLGAVWPHFQISKTSAIATVRIIKYSCRYLATRAAKSHVFSSLPRFTEPENR